MIYRFWRCVLLQSLIHSSTRSRHVPSYEIVCTTQDIEMIMMIQVFFIVPFVFTSRCDSKETNDILCNLPKARRMPLYARICNVHQNSKIIIDVVICDDGGVYHSFWIIDASCTFHALIVAIWTTVELEIDVRAHISSHTQY